MLKATAETVAIKTQVANAIKDHSKREAAKGNYEAVGFVASKFGRDLGSGVAPMHNHASDPKHAFFVEPWEQYRVEKKLEQQGREILGVYHSHVSSEALPSMSDHTMARPGEFVFIYSVVFDDLRAYKEEDGNLVPVELVCE